MGSNDSDWCNYKQLVLSLHNDEECVRFLQEKGILHTNRVCKGGRDMKLRFRKNGNIYWICQFVECIQYVGVRKDTWIYPSRLPLIDIILFIYGWCYEWTSIKWCERELNISRKAVVDWNNYLREVCSLKLLHSSKKIGGDNTTVEIYESLFNPRKYNLGKTQSQQWVIGGICRETKEVFLHLIPDRKKETVLPIVEECVLPGTKIYTDEHKAYEEIYKLGYDHHTVNHSQNFVDPTIGAHTQIERWWRSSKERTKGQCRTRRDMLDSYMTEYLWRQSLHGKEPFAEILKDIATFYPPK
ncbi:hypothetical protein J437_LFUL000054 [Ladona fulva]|uniref:ISXO2-like transposase domain-containing protein n=1 Tax=Ladona fulva TaxID=123851 RepID=A0A8K0K0F4_LADFU|nr:hypothetical protein J437_LFUL000054 [Ladona fulva]